MDKLLLYKLIHYTGIFILMLSLGSIFTKYNKSGVIGHGVGLFLILLGAFGMQARLGLGWPNWFIAKFIIWLIFGASIVLAKRGILKGYVAWIVMIGLAFTAAYLGLMKPF